MKNKNVLVIALLIVVIALVLLLSKLLPKRLPSLPEDLAPVATQSDAPSPTAVPAAGYVLVSTSTTSRWFPLPKNEDESFAVRQTLGDEVLENVIHLTPEGVYMESSTCDGQDCVQQGMVTLDNKGERVLAQFIICLPQQVTVELYTPDEILQMAQQMQASAAE